MSKLSFDWYWLPAAGKRTMSKARALFIYQLNVDGFSGLISLQCDKPSQTGMIATADRHMSCAPEPDYHFVAGALAKPMEILR